MNKYLHYTWAIALCLQVGSTLNARYGQGHRLAYNSVRSVEAFDRIINNKEHPKKYALVLFYQRVAEKEGTHKKVMPEADQAAFEIFKKVSVYEKFKHHKYINFIMVLVEKDKGGAELFQRYSPQTLPAYVLLEDGKEEKKFLQAYPLDTSMKEEQLEQFLDHVLQ